MSVVEESEVKNRRPKDSKFRQQALRAWQPILTAGTVLPTFFVIGVAFIPIGVGLIYFSNEVHEVTYDYTACTSTIAADKTCADVLEENKDAECSCEVDLNIAEDTGTDQDWQGNVFIYYGLTNFYQNHRRYVKSRDDKQLYGDLSSQSKECQPFLNPANESDKFFAPCGAIANSLFNDVITLEYKREEETAFRPVPVSRYNISWDSDKQHKFRNPDVPAGKTLKEVFQASGAVRPKDWRQDIWELDPDNAENNGFQNEDLIVWMRAAALPNFRKLYRRVDHKNEMGNTNFDEAAFRNGLQISGVQYKLKIDYRFRVQKFHGTKSVIISTTSLLGGRNPFLGIAYIVVGCICFLMGVIFLFIHLRFGRTTQEMMNISSRTPYN